MKIFEQSNIKVDLSIFVDSRALICANSGGGKSYAIRKILESAGKNVMSIVLDVEGEFKTLREKYDFLLIGQPGDVPVNIKSAPMLPQKLMELNVSAIIDISDLKRHDRIIYVKKFIEALMELPKKFWKPCLVIVDEAHSYCGQREKQESTRAVIDLMTRGRKRGYCGVLATQRISKLHKDAAAEANNIMIGRTGLDIDMARASEILGFATKADKLSLRDLCPGDFFVFGPAISREVKLVKVGKVKTTHPKVGMDLRKKIAPPTAKIKSILSKLNDLPKEAEQKAKTIKELSQQIRQLQNELRKKPFIKADKTQIKQAEQRGRVEGQRQYLALQKEYKSVVRRLQKISVIAAGQLDIKPESVKVAETIENIEYANPARKPKPKPAIKPISIDNVDDTKLNLCERKICSALYNHQDMIPFTKRKLGVFIKYAYKGGGFNNALGHLNTLGLINRSGDRIELTEEGLQQIPELLNSDLSLCERIDISNWQNHSQLGKCERAIFTFLLANPTQEFSKEEIGPNTDPPYEWQGGGFNNALGKLNTLGLIDRSGGRIKINSEILGL